MASLKNIINTDDDHVDPSSAITPNSTTRQPLRPDSSAAASTYPPTRDHPASAASHNNLLDPTQLSSRYYPAEPSSSTGALPGRRPSNTSIDSMESPYGPGPSVPSSSSAMRPYAQGMAGPDLVKLTPITGKISKAKKGQPVHTCDKCPKTFTRAEHLRRHQLSHAPPELHCTVPNCGKTFYRKDLLERHLQRHEQDDEKTSKKSHHSSKRRGSKSSSHSYGGSTHRESGLQMPEAFVNHQINPRNDLTSTPSMAPGPWPPMDGNPGTGQSHNAMEATEDYTMQGVTDQYVLGQTAMHIQATTPESFGSTYAEPRGLPDLPLLYIPDNTPAAPAWQDNATMPSSASDSTYSTPSDNTRRHRFPPARTSSGEWNAHIPAYQTATTGARSPVLEHAGFQIPLSYSVSPPQIYQPVFGGGLGLPLSGYDETPFYDPDQNPATSVRRLSPQLAVAQSSETLVTIPSVPTTDHLFNGTMCGGPPTERFGILGSRDMALTPLTHAAREAIPKYLNVYWEKVHPLYPVVHKPSLETASDGLPEHVDVLRCAMAAVATQFLAEKEHRNLGAQLHNYAWHKSKVFTSADSWPRPVKQTLLLCEYYARFRGRKKESYKPSPRFGSLYHRVFNNQNAFIPIPTERNTMDQWMDWIDMETRRRLLAACFLLDVHSARYHEQRFAGALGLNYSFPGELAIPLSGCTDELWNASTPQEWSALQTTSNPLTLRDYDLESLTPQEISAMSPFDSAIFLAACALQLPCRQELAQVDSMGDSLGIQTDALPIAKLFPDSAVANTYLALHHTPLYFLLSVSGNSWVFNEKVIDESSFAGHKKCFSEWRESASAAMATVYAARALKAFFGLEVAFLAHGEGLMPSQADSSWGDISDYWGVYVCALICWAFGGIGEKDKNLEPPSREEVEEWISTVAEMEPNEVQHMSDKHVAHGVVTLAHARLEADYLGGRSILLADAVDVLKMLG